MKNDIIIAGKPLTKDMVDKLDDTLTKGNMEQIKKQMEKLFTFKNIYNMHDDHIIELGESIVDLWMSEDKAEWARGIESYVQLRMSRYQRRKKKCYQEVQWAKVTKNMDEIATLDLTYRLWVYESGFEHSHFQMYSMLYQITQDILQRKKEEKTWHEK